MDTKVIESFLNRINSVITSRIVQEENQIREIHIVSDTSRNPKQIARDVESVMVSQFDLNVDYKMISVAQIQGDALILKTTRLKLFSIENKSKPNTFTSTVVLEKDGEFFEGSSSGIATANNITRVISLATINAIENCCGLKNIFAIEEIAKLLVLGKETIVIYITAIIGDQEILVSGSAVTAKNSDELAVKSVLDAVNRIVSRFLN